VFEHAEDTVKIKIFNNCAVCWFILYGYITMHGAKTLKRLNVSAFGTTLLIFKILMGFCGHPV